MQTEGEVEADERAPAQAGRAPDEQRALEVAYRYIGARERTVAEVRAKLIRAGFEPALARAAIAELGRLGALDDARYARLFAADKRLLENWGGERIARELARRGIERGVIEAAIADEDADSELERAVALIERRWGAGLHDDAQRRRALGLLRRKGFSGEVAHEALETARQPCTDRLRG